MEMIWRYMMIYDDIWQFLLVKKEGGSHLFGSGMAFFHLKATDAQVGKKNLGRALKSKGQLELVSNVWGWRVICRLFAKI